MIGQKTEQEFQRRFEENVLPLLKGSPSSASIYAASKFFMNLPFDLTYWLQDLLGDYRVRVRFVALNYRDIGHLASGAFEDVLWTLKFNVSRGRVIKPLFFEEEDRGQVWYIYVVPLFVQKKCLPCHDPGAPYAEEIRKAFPEDRALGLKEGELRGAIVIEMARGALNRFVSRVSRNP